EPLAHGVGPAQGALLGGGQLVEARGELGDLPRELGLARDAVLELLLAQSPGLRLPGAGQVDALALGRLDAGVDAGALRLLGALHLLERAGQPGRELVQAAAHALLEELLVLRQALGEPLDR